MSLLASAIAAATPRAAPPAPMAPPAQHVVHLRDYQDDYQDDFVHKVRIEYRSGHKAVLLVAATGAGKCLARGTPVMMFDGTVRPVEDIAVGDLLMGPDSLPRRVESLARGREEMCKVDQTDGCSYVVNESHILSLRHWYSHEVRNIEAREYLSWSINQRKEYQGWRVPGILSGDLEPQETGISVVRVGVGDYFGFEISGPDRLFLLGDFTVTHNTVVFSYIAKSAAHKGSRVLILAHRDQLIKQASRKLSDNGVQHGIIMAGFTPNPRRLVQVASVQTLVRRVAKMLAAGVKFDLIVIDEAHLSCAKSYMDILAAWPDARVLGVTGSPIRLDGKGLGRHAGGAFDTLVQGISIRELIQQGFLVKPTVYASKQQIDLSGVKKIGGEYDADAMADIMDKPVITGSAIAEYQKICPGVPAVAWCTNVAHARHVADEFNAAGIPAMALSGENSSEERDRALAMLSDGRLKLITFAMLLVEGVDCPAIGAVILLRLTMSLSSYLQTIGRGLRPIYAHGMPLDTSTQRFAAVDAGPKGRKCFVIDHCGLWQKHGFADADREWTLDGVTKKKGKKKDDEPKIDLTQCPKCFVVFDPKLNPAGREHVCPECGHEIPGRQRRGPEHVDGELAEITPEMEAVLKQQKRVEVARASTLADLEKIAAQRGYSKAWAGHIWNARQRKNSGKSRAF